MKRFLLTSCATGLVLAALAGNSAVAQTTSYNVPSGTSQNVSGPVTDNGSTPTSIDVTGGGTLVLDGVNTYTGGTSVSGNSTLQVGNDGNLGAASGGLTLGGSSNQGTLSTSSPTFTSGRKVTLNAGGGQIMADGGSGWVNLSGPISGSGQLLVIGGNVSLSGVNSYVGGTTVENGGQLVVNSDAALGAATYTLNGVTSPNTINLGDVNDNKGGTLTIASGVSSFTSNRNINLNQGGGIINGVTTPGGVATFSGIVSGGGALSINSGTVALTNTNNSYYGGTYIQGGATLQVNNDSVLGGTGAVNSTYNPYLGYYSGGYGGGYGGGLYPGLTTTSSTGNIFLGDNGSTNVAPQGGTLQFTNTAAINSSRNIVIESGGGTILTNAAAGVTLSGTISGNGNSTDLGGLTVGGTGVLSLTSTNTFLGNVTVLGGATLNVNADSNLGGYTSVTNQTTGQVTSTPNSTLNTLVLDGGKLQFSAATTIYHPIETIGTGSSIDTNGNAVTISSDIGGSGDLTKLGVGVLTLDGTNSYSGGTNVDAGTLVIGDSISPKASVAGNVTVNTGGILGGSGSIGGALINNGGTVAPANTLVAGTYIQNSGATLAPEITPTTSATSSSELKVSGIATISGGTLSVGYAQGFLQAGRYQIFSASSLAGTGFSDINAGVVPSAGLSADVVQEGNSYYVVLSQKSDLPDHPTVLPALTSATIDQTQQTTGALLDRLASARTSALADELAVAMTDGHRVRGTSPYGLWIQPTGNTGSQTGNAANPGYNTQGEGFLMGIDTEWFPGISIGVALGYNHTSLTELGGASGTNSTPTLAIYSGWWSGPFALDGLVGIGMGQIDAARPLDLPLSGTTTVVTQVAASNHVANEKIAALQASGAWALDGWVIGPQLGAKYVNLSQTGYTETGTDIYNFTVAASSINSLRPFASVDVSKRFFIGDHWALLPDLKAGYEHEVNGDARHVEAQTQGDAKLWVFNGLLPGTNILHFLAGLQFELDREQAFYVNYDRMQSNTGQTQYISGGFRYRL